MTPRRRTILWFLLLCAVLAVTIVVRQWTLLQLTDRNVALALDDPGMPAILDVVKRIRPLHARKRPPQPSDWLATHEEPGQTFYEYLAEHPSRVVDQYPTLYVQPLDQMSDTQLKLAGQTADMLSAFYGMPVKILEPLRLKNLPATAERNNGGQRQLLTGHLLDHVLPPRVPHDAAAVLALTAVDLWPGEGWNFVFGQASLNQRVGVWSISRFGDPDESEASYRQCLRRTLGVALHETGHMFGILHCTAYECGMNGANNLRESDLEPLDFCPECAAKVLWACRATSAARYGKLADLAQSYGLTDEAQHWQRLHARFADH